MTRINTYESLRDSIKKKDNTINIYSKFMIGGFSGGMAQLIASPCDLIKVRYITNSKHKTFPKRNTKSRRRPVGLVNVRAVFCGVLQNTETQNIPLIFVFNVFLLGGMS